jgi:hypothetical protein
MIAQRFRSVGWVVGVALAAILLYIISLQVATERGRLEAIDRKIAMTKRDIRQLQTEMGTRASLRQLERWNGDVLALSSPGASQYLNSEEDISKIDRSNMGAADAPPPPMMAAVMVREPAAASQPTEAKVALSDQDRQVQEAVGTPRSRAIKPVAMADSPATTLRDFVKSSRAEVHIGGKPKP